MYLLYLDESDTTIDKKADEITPRWYCVSGMLIVGSSYGKIQRSWESFVKKYKLPENFEIKGEELYQGTGYWKNEPPHKRIGFCKEVCKFIKSSNIKIYSALEVVKNNKHAKSYKELLNNILTRVAKYIASTRTRGRQFILIFDQREDIRNEILEKIRLTRKEIIKEHKKSCTFIDYGFEGDSRLCFGIQIADFVSYFLRRQQIAQRKNSLFKQADNKLSISVVDDIVEGVKDKCKVCYLTKRYY